MSDVSLGFEADFVVARDAVFVMPFIVLIN